tara:strand:- start:588 stop:716 length:129 start_codon:yes stop_codon:yes gene_type:complete
VALLQYQKISEFRFNTLSLLEEVLAEVKMAVEVALVVIVTVQ